VTDSGLDEPTTPDEVPASEVAVVAEPDLEITAEPEPAVAEPDLEITAEPEPVIAEPDLEITVIAGPITVALDDEVLPAPEIQASEEVMSPPEIDSSSETAAPDVEASSDEQAPEMGTPVDVDGPVPLPAPPKGDDSPAAESFGRVEPDGTVWVRTSSGEVRVGQYQAGAVDQALTYFARKFTTLEVEVEVLERRLAAGADISVDDAQTSVERLRAALVEPQVVGDIDGLRRRVDRLAPVLEARKAALRAHRTALREAARVERERIVGEAETLAESTSWKSSGDRLKTLLDEWKAAPHVDRGVEQSLWKRFSAARNSFDRRRRAYFAKLSTEQDEAKALKETLVAETERLAGSTEWAATAAEMRTLMDRWKAAGRAGKTADDQLWQAFRVAQDRFYEARSAALAERDADLSDNLTAKEALANEAEGILPVGDLPSAKATLRDVQERWEKIGHVPRGDRERIEGRLRRVEQSVREAEESRWRRSNPEARARAQAAVDQLVAAIDKLERQVAKARDSGNAKALTDAEESIAARRLWLAEAERALADFGGR
jgi:hypothetical protein